MYPGFHEPPLPSPAHESLSTSKPAGQQEASLVPTTANPSPSPPTPSTSTVPLVFVQQQNSVLEITSNETLSSSSTPTNSMNRYFAELRARKGHDDVQYLNFGHDCDRMWVRSGHYTLDDATTHTETMEASLGGTKIENPLKVAIVSRHGNSPAPMAMFILTDGEASASASPPKCAKTSPSPITAFAHMQLKEKTSSSAASGYRLLVERLLSRTSRSIEEFHLVISPVPICPLRLPAFLRCIPEPYASAHPQFRAVHPRWNSDGSSPPSSLSKSNRHPLNGSPQPLSSELTVPTRGVQLKDSETRIPTLIHNLAASQHEKSRAALPSPIDLVPVLPGEIVEESLRS
ncbi:hypothetical protein PQX77_016257 [Marasmius sp. AFHP31]|nr:hypothetical protein PQX77_016257 [Marasmius sp. AFHP31]